MNRERVPVEVLSCSVFRSLVGVNACRFGFRNSESDYFKIFPVLAYVFLRICFLVSVVVVWIPTFRKIVVPLSSRVIGPGTVCPTKQRHIADVSAGSCHAAFLTHVPHQERYSYDSVAPLYEGRIESHEQLFFLHAN